jgi:hypothetical protein
MNLFYCGASLLFAGAIPTILLRHRVPDTTIESFLANIRTFSIAGKESFDNVKNGDDPCDNSVQLSAHDRITAFWNSRLFLRIANRARLSDPLNGDLTAMFEVMQENHSRLRWLLILSIIESFVGKLGFGMYARILLWTYGEELELLSLISQKCGPEGNAIRAIL